MKVSFSAKIILIYGIVFITVILLTFWVSYQGTVGKLEEDLKGTNLALLKQVDEKVEVTFRQAEKELLALTEDLEFVYFMHGSYEDRTHRFNVLYDIHIKLKNFINSNSNFSSVFVYSSASGDILTEKIHMENAAAEENWLQNYMDMPKYFTWLGTHQVWDGQAYRDVVTLIRPYPTISKPGYRKGMLAVNINEKVLHDMINAVYEENRVGNLFILDAEGNVVSHDDKMQIYRNMNDLPYIQKILSRGESGTFTVELDGIDQSVFYRSSAYTGWKLISIVPEAQIYKPLQVTRNLLIAFAAGMLALVLFVLVYVNRWTFKPLDRIVGKISDSYNSRKPQLQGVSTGGFYYLETVFDQMLLDQERLEKHVRDSKPVLKWRIMMDLLAGSRTEYQSVKPQLEFLGVKLHPEWFLVCTAEIVLKDGVATPRDEVLYTYAFCNVAEEMIKAECAAAAIDLGNGKAAVLCSFAERDMEQNNLRLLAILELILDVMKKQFHLHVTVGIGRCYRDMKDIALSSEESRKALHYKMVMSQQSIIAIDDLQLPESQDYYRLSLLAEPLTDALRQTDMDRVKSCLAAIFSEVVASNLPPEFIRQLSFDLIVKSLQAAEATGIDMGPTTESLDRIHEELGRCESWRMAESLVASVLEQLALKIEERRSNRGRNDAIERMLKYVQEHYGDSSLSLDRLSEEFHLSPTYISKLFKEYTEHNFIDHLIEIRINSSKALLADTDLKVSQIAETVGYTNTGSFLRTFKKYTGKTPTDYREESRKPL